MLRISQDKNHKFPKTKEKWAAFINHEHNLALEHRRAFEFQWAVNIAYWLGHQDLVYNSILGDIERDDRELYIINRVAPFVEQRAAKLTKSKPITAVTPDKMDRDIVHAAKDAEHLSKYLWKKLDKDAKFIDATFLAIVMGSSFKKIIWNDKVGDSILDDTDKDGNILFDENTGARKQSVIFQGEIENSTKDAFKILVPWGFRTLQECPWVMDRMFMTKIEVKERFKDFKMESTFDHFNEVTRYEKFVAQLGSPLFKPIEFGGRNFGVSKTFNEFESVLVKQFWMKPNAVYKKGVVAVVAGDQLLSFEEWPYDHMEYPFIKIDEHRNPMRFYGESTVSRMIPLQRHYNESRTQIARNSRFMANPKWWAAKGSGLAEDALTDEEGEIVETNDNMRPPQQLAVAPMPNYSIQNQQQDIDDIRDISGEREASQVPFPGITAGVALETAAELSDIGLIPTLRGIEKALSKEAKMELQLANQYYAEPRLIKIYGENASQLTIRNVKGIDLKNQTDITLQLETELGLSRSAIQQKMIDMWDRRIITDNQAFKRAFVTGNWDEIMKEEDASEAVVIGQLEQIKQGANPVVLPTDNHINHVRMLSKFMETPEFRRMPPDRQQIAMVTLQQHLAFLGQGVQQAPQQNPAAVGTPFGPQVTEGPQQ